MKNFKWGTTSFSEEPIYVVLFVSRNKDNKDIEGFKERRESFITHDDWASDKLQQRFSEFVERGVSGEFSRMYYSVNKRDGDKIHKQLLHFLFDNPDFNLCSIMPKIAGIAATKECAGDHKWLFDFDNDDFDNVMDFTFDIIDQLGSEKPFSIERVKTPHGYAVIVDRGFDCRELLKKYPYVTLKRDDLICVQWREKE